MSWSPYILWYQKSSRQWTWHAWGIVNSWYFSGLMRKSSTLGLIKSVLLPYYFIRLIFCWGLIQGLTIYWSIFLPHNIYIYILTITVIRSLLYVSPYLRCTISNLTVVGGPVLESKPPSLLLSFKVGWSASVWFLIAYWDSLSLGSVVIGQLI